MPQWPRYDDTREGANEAASAAHTPPIVTPAPEVLAVVPDATGENVIALRAPYNFEGKVYATIDLSGIDALTTADLTAAEKAFVRAGGTAMMPELSIAYCAQVAARATGLPIEFFDRLPARDMIAVKNHLIASFFGDAG